MHRAAAVAACATRLSASFTSRASTPAKGASRNVGKLASQIVPTWAPPSDSPTTDDGWASCSTILGARKSVHNAAITSNTVYGFLHDAFDQHGSDLKDIAGYVAALCRLRLDHAVLTDDRHAQLLLDGVHDRLDIAEHFMLPHQVEDDSEWLARKIVQLRIFDDAAGVMKAAVAYLEPKMEKASGSQKGTIVLATVKGDVHDIGKNLVDIILSNNGYTVVTKAAKEFTDASGRRKVKGSMDVELAVDAMEMTGQIDQMFLFSGDGDFRPLLEAMQRRGVHPFEEIRIEHDLRRIGDLDLEARVLRALADGYGLPAGGAWRPAVNSTTAATTPIQSAVNVPRRTRSAPDGWGMPAAVRPAICRAIIPIARRKLAPDGLLFLGHAVVVEHRKVGEMFGAAGADGSQAVGDALERRGQQQHGGDELRENALVGCEHSLQPVPDLRELPALPVRLAWTRQRRPGGRSCTGTACSSPCREARTAWHCRARSQWDRRPRSRPKF